MSQPKDGVRLLLGEIATELFQGGLSGIEREALRVTPSGVIANTPHPSALGAAMTHPYITTDFSEAQLELVTPPFAALSETLGFLDRVHAVVRSALADEHELMWPASMPALFENEDDIAIARFGHSNVGRMKQVYRAGLAHRYGRAMQAISGVHFNYSLPETVWPVLSSMGPGDAPLSTTIANRYFGMLRNFKRYGWLILYLFGCSPAVCKSFFGKRQPNLPDFDAKTAYLPFATSLRMSDLGYKNRNQAALKVSYNGLDEYVSDLAAAMSTPNPGYQEIGVRVAGSYRQLNANMLQIENEFYSMIRPKRRAFSGEKPSCALITRGVEYVEVRALDVNVFEPSGVCPEQLDFLVAFLTWCALSDSPPVDSTEWWRIENNQGLAAREGRDPSLQLARGSCAVRLRDWASEVLDGVMYVAQHLDAADGRRRYQGATIAQRARIDDPELTLSARVLREMQDNAEAFSDFALRYASSHAAVTAGKSQIAEFAEIAAESIARQQDIEANDQIDFETYLSDYFGQSPGMTEQGLKSA